jgi:predicted protein tyrosine phosphatase
MITRVGFCGREQAVDTPGRPDTAVISITNPGTTPASIRPGWGALLRVEFMDYDMDSIVSPWIRADIEQLGKHMTAAQAAEIVAFVRELPEGITELLVHCEAGVSRSAAVALWACGRSGLTYRPADFLCHNRFVFRLLGEAERG